MVWTRALPQHYLGPPLGPCVAVRPDLGRWERVRILRQHHVVDERPGESGGRRRREHEHVQRDVLLERVREQEVDKRLGGGAVGRTGEYPGELDLPEAGVGHDASGRRVDGRVRIVVFFQAEDGIRDLVRSRGLGDVYKETAATNHRCPGRDFANAHPRP